MSETSAYEKLLKAAFSGLYEQADDEQVQEADNATSAEAATSQAPAVDGDDYYTESKTTIANQVTFGLDEHHQMQKYIGNLCRTHGVMELKLQLHVSL